MPRKTVDVAYVREKVNDLLKHGNVSDDFRKGASSVLESILHHTGNYNGYNYSIDRPQRKCHILHTASHSDMCGVVRRHTTMDIIDVCDNIVHQFINGNRQDTYNLLMSHCKEDIAYIVARVGAALSAPDIHKGRDWLTFLSCKPTRYKRGSKRRMSHLI